MSPCQPQRRVLIVCTGNACRSQMAEALWRYETQGRDEVVSAGTMPAGVHPLARAVIEELGIDTSEHYSKSVFDLDASQFDLVITVCDAARDTCLAFPGHPNVLHWPFEDPISARGALDERLAEFRRVRDVIRERIRAFLAEQKGQSEGSA